MKPKMTAHSAALKVISSLMPTLRARYSVTPTPVTVPRNIMMPCQPMSRDAYGDDGGIKVKVHQSLLL